tara:strand:- start:1026 stop:1331 length:306 start_codon:yes stop_codon:yes gene_type:complete
MIIYVDIDETICEYSENREYPKATPIKNNIRKINSLHDKGDIIVYWTARGSTTGIDWTDLTKNQLKSWGAKYTDLRLGKPHYDLFICDKAINTLTFFKEEK